jgi:hypothetical protein
VSLKHQTESLTCLVYRSFANSAIAANTLMRSIVGGTFPLFTPAMIHRLGYSVSAAWSRQVSLQELIFIVHMGNDSIGFHCDCSGSHTLRVLPLWCSNKVDVQIHFQAMIWPRSWNSISTTSRDLPQMGSVCGHSQCSTMAGLSWPDTQTHMAGSRVQLTNLDGK